MGPNLTCLLTHYWERQKIVPKAGNFMGKVFSTGRVITLVEPASPIIFNIVVYVVASEVLEEFCGPQEARHGMGSTAG